MDQVIELQDFHHLRMELGEHLKVGGHSYSLDEIFSATQNLFTLERRRRIEEVLHQRTLHFRAVLEGVYDRGNMSAVMRSFEGLGFLQLHVVEPEGFKFKSANRVTKGTEKWLDVRQHATAIEAVSALKDEGVCVLGTHLAATQTLDTVDFTRPTAVVLGNEKEGLSEEMMRLVDGSIKIPMLGFCESFNISVAAALIFYHARQELKKHGVGTLTPQIREQIRAHYYLRCVENPAGLLSSFSLRARARRSSDI